MHTSLENHWIAFAGKRRLALGPPREVATAVKHHLDGARDRAALVFDASTGHAVEIDWRGSLAAVLKRLPAPAAGTPQTSETEEAPDTPRQAGRPKLGVVAREVTLLPRHWEWLAAQPGGASVALRRLVEHARKVGAEADRVRAAREAAYRIMHAMAGDAPGFEEASRALFAGDAHKLEQCMAPWPADVRRHALVLADAANPAA